MNMVVFWLIAAIIFIILEVITASLCSIWFAAGALISMLIAAFSDAIWVQLLFFILVSALCFALLYPRLKHHISRNRQATNADKVIGQTCIVTQRIDNIAGTGSVSIDGKTWTARTSGSETIEPHTLVCVDRIEGVKLIVTPAKQAMTIN